MKAESVVTTLVILLAGSLHSSSSESDSKDKQLDSSGDQDSPKLENRRSFSDFSNLHLHDTFESSQEREAEAADKPHSRKKRLIWVTDDGRLALPPGTSLTITPTLALPFVRYPPEGFFSNISVSLPLTLDFDKLGLTDNQNPLGTLGLHPLLARQAGRMAGSILSDYVDKYLFSRQKRRSRREAGEYFHVTSNSVEDEVEVPKLPEASQHAFHGGERALMYAALEDFLMTFGMDGRGCLLRTICEIHSRSVEHLGLVGEMAKLFLTATKSPFSHLMDDYVKAEKVGKGEVEPGECFPYYKDCSRSLFKAEVNKYRRKTADEAEHPEDFPSIPSM